MTASVFDVELPPAPYPGLRPFEQHEWPVFFGREAITAEAIRRLLGQNMLVVHGDSGCGKSSLVRAGMLVQLEQRYARGDQHWRTCTMLPREAPLRKLATALAKLIEEQPSIGLIREIRRDLNAGRGAAAKLEKLLCPDPGDRLCILVDQFEDLFRFARETSVDEAQLFVDVLVGLLDEAERQRDSEAEPPRLYVVLTMRSEFLGVCARFKGLAGAVNKTQYLLPQMDRPALLRAIREPAPLYGGLVDVDLAERLITDAGGTQDQLPLIQHGLMLLWRQATGGDPDKTDWRLRLEDYHPAGGLAGLLSDHADEVMQQAATDPRRAKNLIHLFRALTDINADGHAIRRPQTLAELVEVAGGDEPRLLDIIDRFRKEGVSFLRPYGDEPIAPSTEIDISHEALIRCWQKLANKKDGWLQREFRDGLIWRTLLVQAESFAKDPTSVLSPARTEELDRWIETLPSKTWCQRYGGGWTEVEQLLQASRDSRERQIRKDWWIRWGSVAASIVFLLLTAFAFWNWQQATSARMQAVASWQRAEESRAHAEASKKKAEDALAQVEIALLQAKKAEQEATFQARAAAAARSAEEAARIEAELRRMYQLQVEARQQVKVAKELLESVANPAPHSEAARQLSQAENQLKAIEEEVKALSEVLNAVARESTQMGAEAESTADKQEFSKFRTQYEKSSVCRKFDMLAALKSDLGFGVQAEFQLTEPDRLRRQLEGSPVVVTEANLVVSPGPADRGGLPCNPPELGARQQLEPGSTCLYAWIFAPGPTEVLFRVIEPDGNRRVSRPMSIGRNPLWGERLGYQLSHWRTFAQPGEHTVELVHVGGGEDGEDRLLCETTFELTG
ncbi:MAG: ATP-binding protein [Pseudomonadota bacterium]